MSWQEVNLPHRACSTVKCLSSFVFCTLMDALPFRPLALPAGRSRRRLEVFSPKLGRRLSLSSYDAWRCWLALEANPAVLTFCERPTRFAGSGSSILDFWVSLKSPPVEEFWLIVDDSDVEAPQPEEATFPSYMQGRPLRLITPALLATLTIPLGNWAQILPLLVSFRNYRQPLLEQSIVVELATWTSLASVMERFADADRPAVQAAVFWLVASGRVTSPDLAAAPLGNATRFRRQGVS